MAGLLQKEDSHIHEIFQQVDFRTQAHKRFQWHSEAVKQFSWLILFIKSAVESTSAATFEDI